MNCSIGRRRLLAALAAGVPATAGCIGGTPTEIPVDLENADSQEHELSIQIRRDEGSEPVFDGTFTLKAGAERDEIEVLDAGESYVLSASLTADGELREEVSTGGGTISLTIEIGSGGELRTRKTVQ